jgi:hypothetical protein
VDPQAQPAERDLRLAGEIDLGPEPARVAGVAEHLGADRGCDRGAPTAVIRVAVGVDDPAGPDPVRVRERERDRRIAGIDQGRVGALGEEVDVVIGPVAAAVEDHAPFLAAAAPALRRRAGSG